jgi:MFS transporter, DHA2 family, multidrug resistance protein
VFQVLAIPFYTLCTRYIDLRWLMMAGLACFALGMWYFTPITHDWGWRELLLPQAFRGFAQLFAVAPTVSLTLGGLAPERLKLASGLFNLMRNLGGAIGIAACGTILNDRANLHFLRLAEHLNTTNSAMLDLLQRVTAADTMKWGGDSVHAHAAATKRLWSLAWREAQTQTYADAFLAIAACFVIATAMVPLMRKVAPPTAPAPAADTH